MSKEPENALQCSQFEARLAEALDGALAPDALKAFEAHGAECGLCGPLLTEARDGLQWLRQLQSLEPPKNLVHNILAATTRAQAEAEQVRAADAGWLERMRFVLRPGLAALMRSRFATSFAMAFFSLSLVLSIMGVRIGDLSKIDWRPSAIQKSLTLQYSALESKVVRYYENMRLVYEVENRVRELKRNTPSGASEQPAAPPNNNKKNADPNDTSGQPQHENYSHASEDIFVAAMTLTWEGDRI